MKDRFNKSATLYTHQGIPSHTTFRPIKPGATVPLKRRMWSPLYIENEDGRGQSYVKITSPFNLESEEEDENNRWKMSSPLYLESEDGRTILGKRCRHLCTLKVRKTSRRRRTKMERNSRQVDMCESIK
jgi:hypothetical protein